MYLLLFFFFQFQVDISINDSQKTSLSFDLNSFYLSFFFCEIWVCEKEIKPRQRQTHQHISKPDIFKLFSKFIALKNGINFHRCKTRTIESYIFNDVTPMCNIQAPLQCFEMHAFFLQFKYSLNAQKNEQIILHFVITISNIYLLCSRF